MTIGDLRHQHWLGSVLGCLISPSFDSNPLFQPNNCALFGWLLLIS